MTDPCPPEFLIPWVPPAVADRLTARRRSSIARGPRRERVAVLAPATGVMLGAASVVGRSAAGIRLSGVLHLAVGAAVVLSVEDDPDDPPDVPVVVQSRHRAGRRWVYDCRPVARPAL